MRPLLQTLIAESGIMKWRRNWQPAVSGWKEFCSLEQVMYCCTLKVLLIDRVDFQESLD